MAFNKNSSNLDNIPNPGQSGQPAFKAAYTPSSQGGAANMAYRNQSGHGNATDPTSYSRQNPVYSTANKKKGRGKKIALGVVAAVLVVLIGCGTAAAVWWNNINQELTHGTKTQEELDNIQDQLVPTVSYNEPFYMMLIGSDVRENSDEEGARSDTNILVRVDPTTNKVTMVSIPRDTMIDIDGYGTNKFNAAYNYGGAAAVIREGTQLTGINCSHYAEVNFDALINLVDTVGGIDVMVDERIDDTDADYWEDSAGYQHIVIEAGQQHLNGHQALVFARSRAYVDGDFTRTSNQRKVIEAIANKVLSLSVTEMPSVVQAAVKCVTTDMKAEEILSLANQFKNNGAITMYSALLPSITGDVNGTSYVFCDEDATEQMIKTVEEGGDPSSIKGSTSKLAQKYGVSGSSSSSSHSGNDLSGSSSSSSSGSSGTYAGNDYNSGSSGTYSGNGYSNGYSYGSGSSSGTYSNSSGTYGSTGSSTGTGTGTSNGYSAGTGTGSTSGGYSNGYNY